MSSVHHLVNDLPVATRGGVAAALLRVDSLATFGMRVSRQFAQCRREGGQLGLLWVEVQALEPPGQPWGAAAREGVLEVASQRLRNRVRSADEVLRVADDGFAVLLLAAGGREVDLVEQRLLQTLRGAYGVEGQLVQVSVRLGTAVFPEDGRQGADLAEAARSNLR